MMNRRHFLTRLGIGALAAPALFARPRASTASPATSPPTASTAPPPAASATPAAASTLHPGTAAQDDVHALVLGSVQDAGFPQVGCYTELCEHGRALHAAGRGRFVSSLAIVEPGAGRSYLVDATPDITRQLDLLDGPAFREGAAARRPFDGIFLTHAHIGHYTGLAVLGNEGLGIRDTPVYCTGAMAGFLRSNQPWRFLVEQGRIELRPLAPDRWHRVDDLLEVRLLRVPHRDELADTVAFVFRGPERSLLYLPDIDSWSRWERDVAEEVAAVDVALLDGSFWSMDELPGRSIEDIPHPLMTQTMDALQGVVDRGEARVVLTHLNNSNPALLGDGPERAEIVERGFEVAREGMRFGL